MYTYLHTVEPLLFVFYSSVNFKNLVKQIRILSNCDNGFLIYLPIIWDLVILNNFVNYIVTSN